jgi:hypothetical protein
LASVVGALTIVNGQFVRVRLGVD